MSPPLDRDEQPYYLAGALTDPTTKEETMKNISVCRRCGGRRLPPPHDWAVEHDRLPGAAEPVPGGMGPCGDLHDWVHAEKRHPAGMDSKNA